MDAGLECVVLDGVFWYVSSVLLQRIEKGVGWAGLGS